MVAAQTVAKTTVFESNVAALTLTGQVRHVGGRHLRTREVVAGQRTGTSTGDCEQTTTRFAPRVSAT